MRGSSGGYRPRRWADCRSALGRAGFVYVIEGEHGYLKVGHSVSPPDRLGSLQTGSPFRLRILHTLFIRSDAAGVEAEARATLERWKVLNEWFAVTPDVAIAAIYGAATRFGEIGSGDHDAVRNRPASWARRTGLIAAAFTPMWVALSTDHLIVFVPAMFCALVVLSHQLLRSRRSAPLNVPQWAGAITAGLIASIVVGATIGAAHAQSDTPVPVYDAQAYCAKIVAMTGGGGSAQANCLSAEDEARGRIAAVWPTAPQEIRQRCASQAGIAGALSNYQALGGCLATNVGNLWLNGRVTVRGQ